MIALGVSACISDSCHHRKLLSTQFPSPFRAVIAVEFEERHERLFKCSGRPAVYLFQYLDKNRKSGSIEFFHQMDTMGSTVALERRRDTTNKVVKSHLQLTDASSNLLGGWSWIDGPKMEKTKVFLSKEQSTMIRQVLSSHEWQFINPTEEYELITEGAGHHSMAGLDN